MRREYLEKEYIRGEKVYFREVLGEGFLIEFGGLEVVVLIDLVICGVLFV